MSNSIDSLSLQISANAEQCIRTLKDLSNRIGDVSSKLSSMNTSGLANLSSGVSTLSSALNTLPQSDNIKNLASSFRSIGRINTATIEQAGKSIRILASDIAQVQSAGAGATNVTDLAKAIAKLGGKNVTQAVTNIPNLTRELKNMFAELSKSPQISSSVISMTKALAELGNSLRTVNTSSRASVTGLESFSNSARRTVTASKGLASAIGKVYATYWLIFRAFSVFRKAIDYASGLTEVENVVTKTFGNMANSFDAFSKKAKDTLGMSELLAKQIGSRYQAMGKAMGIPLAQISKMSVSLTKLAGDMASFYDIDQEEVAQKLEAVFTGMTRPLRSFGLDITEASLKEYALSKGMDASIKSMTQAEKTMLRYQYVMEHTTSAQGDFLATIDTWANQCRILKQNIVEIGSTIGQVFINAFKPFIKYLNRILAVVQDFAVKVANALGNIFGWTYEANQGGVMTDLEEDTEGFSDALGDANDEAKKLKNTIMGYDELNVMQKPKDDSSGGASDLLGDLSGGADYDSGLGKWVKKYESDINSLWQLGKKFGDKLREIIDGIDWDKYIKKMGQYGRMIAEALNGFIDEDTFGKIGYAVAQTLNGVVQLLHDFAEQFNFKELGRSIASGINSFFETFDFKKLAKTINLWAKGLLDQMNEAIEHTDWFLIGQKIGTLLAEIDFMGIFGRFAQNVMEAINGAFSVWVGSLSVAPIETALISLLALPKVLGFIGGSALFKGIKAYSGYFKTLGGSVKTLGKNFAVLGGELQGAFTFFKSNKALTGVKDLKGLFTDLSKGVNKFSGSLSLVQKAMGSIVVASLEFSGMKKVLYDITNQTGSLGVNIAKVVGIVTASAGAFSLLLGVPAGLIVAGLTAIVGGIMGIKKAWDEADLEASFNGIAESLSRPDGLALEEVSGRFVQSINGIKANYETLSEMTVDMSSTREEIDTTSDKIKLIGEAMKYSYDVSDEKVAELKELFATLQEDVSTVFENSYQIIYYGLASSLGDAVRDAGGSIGEYMILIDSLKSDGEKAIDETKGKLAELDKQLENGTITNKEWAEQTSLLYENLIQLSQGTDEVADAVDNVGKSVDKVDLSQIFDSEDGFDATALRSQFVDPLKTAFDDANEVITTSSDNIAESIQTFINTAELTGNQDAVSQLTKLLETNTQAYETKTDEVKNRIIEAGNLIQVEALKGMAERSASLEAEWEEKSPMYKFFHPKETYVTEQMNSYKTNVLEPLERELQTAYDEMGIEVSTFASEFADGVLDNAFNVTTVETSGIERTKKTLVDGWEGMFEDAVNLIDSEKYGKDMVIGFNTGVSTNSDTTKGVLDSWSAKIKGWIHDGVLNFGSPSKTLMDFGKWTVEGFNQGVDKNKETTNSSITTWTSLIKSTFETNCSADTFRNFASNIVDGFSNGISSMYEKSRSAVEGWATKVSGWFQNKMQIHSPSKLFYQFGGYTVEGFDNAIEDNMSKSVGVMNTWADKITGFQNMVGSSDVFGKGMNANLTMNANTTGSSDVIKDAVIDGMMQVVMATSSNDNKDTSVNLYLDGRVIAQSTYNNLKTMSRQGVIPSFI